MLFEMIGHTTEAKLSENGCLGGGNLRVAIFSMIWGAVLH